MDDRLTHSAGQAVSAPDTAGSSNRTSPITARRAIDGAHLTDPSLDAVNPQPSCSAPIPSPPIDIGIQSEIDDETRCKLPLEIQSFPRGSSQPPRPEDREAVSLEWASESQIHRDPDSRRLIDKEATMRNPTSIGSNQSIEPD
jgi:hypothetical protein